MEQIAAPCRSDPAPCRRTGLFIAKAGAFALHDAAGRDLWLELDPVPLHLMDQQVEITGDLYGADHVWVRAIGPCG
ncbi:DUF5818 domain-containing protein [Sphingomonas morindae]|uniref:DUF5818 domain-containing protein n=1 Tax=Sphingomonas morindae TaxID=1541170 RepID=A0ABY4XAK0_9SPHN|nr:DUF5818 domain-containing protein [Sphingomonas morindae]USI73972.1 DUF5818 domain-containing protein [Sphingomonas morindae]